MRQLDLIIIVIYLATMVIIGIWCRGDQKSVDQYFKAQGGFSSRWGPILIGLSIASTFFSGISFLIYPSVGFSQGIKILIGLVCFPVAWVLLKYWVLPKYLDDNWSHPYEILERRFGSRVRVLGSGMFVLLRLSWLSVLVYAPTLIVLTVLDLPETWFWPALIIVGMSCTVYTAFGGLRGVIITDAIQFIVIGIGTLVLIINIIANVPASAGEVFHYLNESGSLDLFDFSLSLTDPYAFFAIALGFTISNVSVYVADQMALQRYLSTNSKEEAIRSFTINVTGAIVVILLLVSVGLGLSAWSHFNPLSPTDLAADKILPYYLAQYLPAGVSGLMLAAILSATMSSMTSGINSLSGSITNDFNRRQNSDQVPSGQGLSKARWLSFGIGAFATVFGGFTRNLGSLFDIAITILGSFLGPLLALILLALSPLKLNNNAVFAGMILGILTGWGVVLSPVASSWISVFAFISCIGFILIIDTIFYRRQNVR